MKSLGKNEAKIVPKLSSSISIKGLKPGKSFDHSIANILERELAEEQTPTIEVLRLYVKKFLATTIFGKLYENILLCSSIISCMQYIYSTYLSDTTPRGNEILDIFSKLELCLAGLFAFDWCLSLFVADHKSEFFFSFFALIDFTTVIPIWLTYFVFPNKVGYYDVHSFYDVIEYILYAAYTLRILRILRFHKKFIHIEDEVHRFVSQMVLSLVTMMLFEAALMQYLESHVQPLPFHAWVYYIVVTTSTVGYGDITPSCSLGRFMAMFIVTFAITFVPQQTNILIEKMNRSTIWSRAIYVVRGNQKHVLICGDLKSASLLEFFRELFHEDHENMNLNAIILQPEPPSIEMQRILRDPNFSLVTHYLQGSPLNDTDLMRAKADSAIAIFLMGNKFSSNPDEEDAKTILQQFSIKRFIQSSSQTSNPLFCLQLIRPENRRHLTNDGSDVDKELVVCLNEMKMGVMAKACLFPGTSTLIFNLLTSFADGIDDDDSSDEDIDPEDVGSDAGSSDDEDGGSWMNEYQKGCDWEIYTTEMADGFVGSKFSQLSAYLYAKFGIVLFALRVRELKGKGHVRILLNPADYSIPPSEKYYVEGFVIAKNKAASDLSGKGENSTELLRSSQLSLISNAITKTAEVGTAIRRQSMAVVIGNSILKKNDNNPIKASSGWQSVMNQYEHEDTNQNQQEALQKIEDETLKRVYFVRETEVDITSITIETSIQLEFPYMSGHMIVITKSVSNLYDYIKPLRAKYLGKLQPIIILHPFDILEHIWRRLSIFEGIFIVRGSPLEELDIIRAGVFRASQVVVLADPTVQLSADTKKNNDALVDADAIFTYNCVKRLNEKAQILIEIVNHQNVSYLDSTMTMNTHETDYKFTPYFASGALMTCSMLDTIVCQAFYNPQIIRVLDKLVSGMDCIESKDTRNPLVASRRPKAGLQAVAGSSLYQIKIPDNLQPRTYGKLVEHFAKENIVPLGILRGVFSNMSSGAKGNKMPYVYTNPHKDTELFTCDRVFVLSPRVLNENKVSLKDIMANYQLSLTNQNASKEKKRPQLNEVIKIENIKDDALNASEGQKKMETVILNALNHINTKTDQINERITNYRNQVITIPTIIQHSSSKKKL